jgi:site-specific DNA-methyltransferase (adenine-specific)
MLVVKRSKFCLYHAEALDWLSRCRSNTFEAVVTDPPYGLIEYSASEIKNRANGNGIWRLPNQRDGAKRQPSPRFTVLNVQDKAKLRAFTLDSAAELFRILVPGAHVFWATHSLFPHIVCTAFVEVGFEKRGEIIRTISTLRGGERPKGAHLDFPGVCVLPKSCWEPWVLFRKPIRGRIQDNLRRYGTGALRRISVEEPFRDLLYSSPTSRAERRIAPHPSLKPQGFMRQIVHAALPLGRGTILDPFMGAGSTIAAALHLDLASVGIEESKEYFQMAERVIPKLSALADQQVR